MDGTRRLPPAFRHALTRATAALLDAERVVLAGGAVDDDAFDHLVRDYCRAAQALEATWAPTLVGTAGSARRALGEDHASRASAALACA